MTTTPPRKPDPQQLDDVALALYTANPAIAVTMKGIRSRWEAGAASPEDLLLLTTLVDEQLAAQAVMQEKYRNSFN